MVFDSSDSTKQWVEITLSNLFYETSIILIPKQDKAQQKENHRLIFLICRDINILKKMLTNWIQEYIKNIHYDQVDFILKLKG